MKMKFAMIGMLLAVFLVFTSVNLVQAQWPAIKESGYAITTDWHGLDVTVGLPVTATAGTTNPDVPPATPILTVTFEWMEPEIPGEERVIHTVGPLPIIGPIYTPTTPPEPIPQAIKDWAASEPEGTEYWYAQSSFVPDKIGDWGVKAIFADTVYKHHEWEQFTVKRATSFEVVPEVPFGTIAILLGWCGILGVFALRRKHLLH